MCIRDRYADQDIFMPTEGLINEYMPNLKKILDDSENYWSEITAPDGHTYGFPYIEEMYGLVLTGGPLLINKTWLDEVGKEVPTTVDAVSYTHLDVYKRQIIPFLRICSPP